MTTARAVGADRTRLHVDLEQLVIWTVRDQKADRDDAAWHDIEAAVYNNELGGRSYRGVQVDLCRPSADGCATIARNAAVGCTIDGGGPIRGIPPAVHPDAELVADAIHRLRPAARRLVLHHGRTGERPDWSTGRQVLVRVPVPDDTRGPVRHVVEGVWEPMLKRSEIARWCMERGISLFDGAGRRRIVEEERGYQIRHLAGGERQVLVKSCPLELSPSAYRIAVVNGLYGVWHAGMTVLATQLATTHFRDRVLTGFAAPARPWDIEGLTPT